MFHCFFQNTLLASLLDLYMEFRVILEEHLWEDLPQFIATATQMVRHTFEMTYSEYVISQGFQNMNEFIDWLANTKEYDDPLALLLLATWNGVHLCIIFTDHKWHTHMNNAQGVTDPCLFHAADIEDGLFQLVRPCTDTEKTEHLKWRNVTVSVNTGKKLCTSANKKAVSEAQQ